MNMIEAIEQAYLNLEDIEDELLSIKARLDDSRIAAMESRALLYNALKDLGRRSRQ